jgi:hypothetical protein
MRIGGGGGGAGAMIGCGGGGGGGGGAQLVTNVATLMRPATNTVLRNTVREISGMNVLPTVDRIKLPPVPKVPPQKTKEVFFEPMEPADRPARLRAKPCIFATFRLPADTGPGAGSMAAICRESLLAAISAARDRHVRQRRREPGRQLGRVVVAPEMHEEQARLFAPSMWLCSAVTSMQWSRSACMTGPTSLAVSTKSPVTAALPPPVGWKLMACADPIAGGTAMPILLDRVGARNAELVDRAIVAALGPKRPVERGCVELEPGRRTSGPGHWRILLR